MTGAARARLAELLGRKMEAARTFPCSPAQEGLWFLDQRDPGNAAYNLVMAADLRGPLDVPVLARAVDEVARRHEALRTTFESRDGVPFQRVAPPARVPLAIRRVVGSSGGDAARMWIETEARRPFDLARGPLFRAALLAVSDTRHHLVLATHHSIFDGWSMEVVLREIGALYAAFTEGRPSPLGPVAMQYADFASWQRARLREGALDDELARRAAELEGAPAVLPLPTDRPRSATPLPRSAATERAIPATVYAATAALARDAGATPFAAILAAFAVLLARRTGEDDLVIGIPSAGRSRTEFQDTVGFFVDTLPLRIDLRGDPTFGELLRRVRDTLLDALSRPAVPLPLLLDRLGVERVAGAEPLVQVMFAMRDVAAPSLELGAARGEVTTIDSGTSKFDLSFYAEPVDGALSSRLAYRADLFDAASADAMLGQLARLLEQAVADPSRRVSELELLSPDERERVVTDWNRTATAYPRERYVHELFTEQAALTPDAVALDSDAGALTYAELESRANGLAHLLRQHGVRADARVGVLLDRGPDLVATLLAILKAGGAYVPLDPEYPAERLAFMLRDSGAALVVTDATLADRLGDAGCAVLRLDAAAETELASGISAPGASTPAASASGASALGAFAPGASAPAASTPPTSAPGASTPPASAPGVPAPPTSAPGGEPPGWNNGKPAEAGSYADDAVREGGLRAVVAANSFARNSPDNLAYIVYTSGSTGTPKGVMVPHRAVVRLVRGATYARFGPAETHLLLAPVTFDAATFEIWGALLNGARLAIAPPGPLSPAELGTVLERFDVRTLWLTAGLFHQVVDAAPEALRPLRQLLAGGEALSPAHCRRALEAHPELRLINGYGPTENTTFSCCHTVREVTGDSIPIGRPIQNSRAYVLDARLRPVPIGTWGELYVGGDGVARGYLGRPALTAERFIPDAFSEEPGARLYRTGDRVRWSAEGVLEFGGRFDQQLKVRGHRIEPGEIEAVLLAHSDVVDAAVVALGEADDKRLVAYVVPRGDADTAALRADAAAKLPAYMVPSAFVVLDRLPLTRNGKLDRRALPAPEYQAGNAYTAPRTPTEETLAAIWAEVLGVERVGVDDGFFDLGGHSLLATRVVSRAQAALGVELPLRLLFEHPTIAVLAARLDERRREGQQLRLDPITRVTREGALPLSFGQERLWFLERLTAGSSAYHVPLALRLSGELDVRALEGAWSEIVRRHEVLRTRYVEHEGTPAQLIEPATHITIPVEDLPWPADDTPSAADPVPVAEVILALEAVPASQDARSNAGSERTQKELRERLSAEALKPFDLAAAPPVRVRLWKVAEDEHVLMICIHHIATDGWSTGVLLGELSALYSAMREGRTPRLPEPAVQYADYAAWQREHLSGERLDGQLGYWRTRLAGAPQLELPTDRVASSGAGRAAADVHLRIPAPLGAELERLARSERATRFAVLLAAWQALLGRMSGQDDFVIGSPIAGRTRPELEGVVGFFVNTLALRTDLSGDPTFRELLARVRETALGAFQHQELPFEQLVEELAPQRSLEHNPVFQVAFALQDEPRDAPPVAGMRLATLPVDLGRAKFDLLLAATPRGSELELTIEYRTELFDAATAERMLAQYARLLEQAAAAPDLRLSAVELLSSQERQRVVEDWNRTAADFPRGRCVHELFAEQAARTPHALALEGEAGALTYAELDARSTRLAHLLRARGVRAETRVGVLLGRGPELGATLLAILKAGGAYVPLDPEYPAERLAFMLRDSGAALVVTDAALAGRLGDAPCAVLRVDAAADPAIASAASAPGASMSAAFATGTSAAGTSVPGVPISAASVPGGEPPGWNDGKPDKSGSYADGAVREGGLRAPAAVSTAGTPQNLAYIVYTSGSTGTPKGVMVSHEGLANLCAWHARAFDVGPDARATMVASVGFDASVWELWPYLLAGASVRAVPAALRLAPAELGRWMEAERVTHTFLPTPLAEAMLAEGAAGPSAWLLTGGDRMRRTPGAGLRFRVANNYGPTESTVVATTLELEPGAPGEPPIGRPIDNTRTYVLDAALRPVPAGAWGELHLGGVQLARGYLGRPGLTAERFIPDPFSEPGARLYRTGDRVRWTAEGVLEYGGRMDGQIKVRGHRIEPGEIEAVLLAHPDVAEAAVVALGEAEEKRLVAYLVLRDGTDTAALRAHAETRLPAYMIPSAFVTLDRLPLTPNGKLDRRALPAPRYRAANAGAAPRTPTEEILAAIWGEVLGVERVGAEDDFFELGGHSLLATRVISRAQAALGVELPLRLLFEHPTVAGLAARADALRREGQRIHLHPIEHAAREGALPLSFGQERLWFLERLMPGTAAYHVPFAMRLTGRLNAGALERALTEIVRRHEVLRTRFNEKDGVPVQVIGDAQPVRLEVEDLAGREAELDARRAEEIGRPFDLAVEIPLRAHLWRLADDEHVLLVCVHHIATDGWSVGVLFRELSALYAAFAAGRPSPLPELEVQYADYAVWQRSQLSRQRMDGQRAYWRTRLEGVAALELPTDRPRPAVQGFRGDMVPFRLPSEVADRLRALARAERCTPFAILLAAWKALLARYTGQDDVVVGTPIAGRTRPELEGVTGFFVNTLALRTDLSGDPTFRELLARVRETTLGAYQHQELPFEQLVEELAPERSLSRNPLFQVMFALQNLAMEPLALPGMHVRPLTAPTDATRFDVELHVTRTEPAPEGILVFDTELFDASTAARMCEHYEMLLWDMLSDPDRRISESTLLSHSEKDIVFSCDSPELERLEATECVHELFSAQAERTPDAIALEFGGETLTYSELDKCSTRMAHSLRRNGVHAETRVGIHLERGPSLVIAMLGVLKAGACYVPLDPAHPPERLAFVARDAGVRIVVGEDLPPALAARVTRVGVDGTEDGPLPPVDPANLAYVLYTSGSTGRPKGVAMPHRPLVSLLRWHREHPLLGRPARTLQFASAGFDVAFQEIFSAWCTGGIVVLVSEETRRDPRRLARFLAEREIGRLFLPSVALQQLAEAGGAGAPPTLREVVSAGEQLRVSPAVRRWLAAAPGCTLHNHYGPTETHVVTAHTLDGGAAEWPELPGIGRAVDGACIRVLDARLQPLPVGVPGELYVGGVAPARGYLDRPGLTAERFIPDPFSTQPGAVLYRTGDRARWRADATLEYLGRGDHQVKIRGYRVEPGEVEAVLARHPSVREVAVAARGDGAARHLVAYVVPATSGELPEGELRAAAGEELPEYMVPSHFETLDALPLTATGKVDRAALPTPSRPRGRAPAPARTALERAVAAVWEEVLETEGIGADDHFFEIGGHSLLAVRVQRRLEERLGREVRVLDLFAHPTVAALAAHLERSGTGEAAVTAGRGEKRRTLARRQGARRATSALPEEPVDGEPD